MKTTAKPSIPIFYVGNGVVIHKVFATRSNKEQYVVFNKTVEIESFESLPEAIQSSGAFAKAVMSLRK